MKYICMHTKKAALKEETVSASELAKRIPNEIFFYGSAKDWFHVYAYATVALFIFKRKRGRKTSEEEIQIKCIQL